MAKAPFLRDVSAPVAAVAQAVTTTVPVGRVPFAGTVKAVSVIPNAGITGANTNTRKYTLVNKKLDGAGTTTVATLQFNSGTNATAFDEKTITLSGTPANLEVAAGDVLVLESAAVGTGIADPGGFVTVSIGRS